MVLAAPSLPHRAAVAPSFRLCWCPVWRSTLSLPPSSLWNIFWVFSESLLQSFASLASDSELTRKFSPWVWALISRFLSHWPLYVWLLLIWKGGLTSVLFLDTFPQRAGHRRPLSCRGTYPLLAFSWHVNVYMIIFSFIYISVCVCVRCWGVNPGSCACELCHLAASPTSVHLKFHFVTSAVVLSMVFERMNGGLYRFILCICWGH